MRAFQYANPGTLEDAIALLQEGGAAAAALAGGTDLLSLMKDDVERPERLVNLKSIASMRGIGRGAGGVLRIGALATIDELLASPGAAAHPALAHAAEGIRSPQLRAMGTVGGELLQRPRCWYYRAGFGLLARRDGRSMVEDGDNRYHAILGTRGPAWFVHASSLAPPLCALGARVKIAGPNGERELPLQELYRVPARDGEREHTLGTAEILTEILVPATAVRCATYEVRQREALDWPLAAAAAALELDGETVTAARIVLGHVAPTPFEASEAAAALVGKALSDETVAAAGDAAVARARPLSHNAYKVQLARVATRRALLAAASRKV
ncbi:MAG TPA: FAD binding domain-containing protein [Thermoanaerobaculia bacterium]|nr:FAD binding domain-containing protein [Thermoanaerobaculia bacterium]